jgi:hypothetical protein
MYETLCTLPTYLADFVPNNHITRSWDDQERDNRIFFTPELQTAVLYAIGAAKPTMFNKSDYRGREYRSKFNIPCVIEVILSNIDRTDMSEHAKADASAIGAYLWEINNDIIRSLQVNSLDDLLDDYGSLKDDNIRTAVEKAVWEAGYPLGVRSKNFTDVGLDGSWGALYLTNNGADNFITKILMPYMKTRDAEMITPQLVETNEISTAEDVPTTSINRVYFVVYDSDNYTHGSYYLSEVYKNTALDYYNPKDVYFHGTSLFHLLDIFPEIKNYINIEASIDNYDVLIENYMRRANAN